MNVSQKAYYGSDEIDSISYLEFGSIDLKKADKTIWAYWQDQMAYDMYMFSRYARDLFVFRDFSASNSGNHTVEHLNSIVLSAAHNKLTDYLFKYAGLITAVQFNAPDEICESGSSLFGWIDEAMACDYAFHAGKNIEGIKKLKYLGSDISSFMNKGAKELHSGLKMRFSPAITVADLMCEVDRLSLFYGLGVSMRYSLRNAEDMREVCQKSELSIFNRLSVSKGKDTVELIYGTGKKSYVISLPALTYILKITGTSAKYCNSSLQLEKDGKDTLRASIVMSKDKDKLARFVANYEDCVTKSLSVPEVTKGEWKDICSLIEE